MWRCVEVCGDVWRCVASKLYGVDATIIIFVFVLYCIVLYCVEMCRGVWRCVEVCGDV